MSFYGLDVTKSPCTVMPVFLFLLELTITELTSIVTVVLEKVAGSTERIISVSHVEIELKDVQI